MRDWMIGLEKREKEVIREIEYLLDRKIEKEEYDHLESVISKKDILSGYGRVEFFRVFPHMKRYRSEKII